MANLVSTVGSDPSRDYATLELWHAGRQLVHTDLVADGDNEIAECYDDGDSIGAGTSGFVISGWNTDANNRVIIRAARGHHHDGTTRVRDASGNGAWLTDVGVGAGSEVMEVYQPHTLISGLRIFVTARTAVLVQGNGVQSGANSTTVNVLAHGEGGSGMSVGKIQGPTMTNVNFIGCVAAEIGLAFALTGIGNNNEARLINCSARDCLRSFSTLESGAPGVTMEIINCLSLQPRAHHYNIAFGTPILIGKANIQDNSGAAGNLPDDDPEFPTFFDVPVVFEEDNPGPAAEQLILRRKDNDDTTTLRSGRNLAFGNGFPEPIANQFLDINGLARTDAAKHIGAFVPVEADPHVSLIGF